MKNTKETRFSVPIAQMEEAIIEDLKGLRKGYSKYKKNIAIDTEIPVDIITVLLKRLKIQGKIEITMIWSEYTGMPNGSGYCLTDQKI
jgi:predicted transcriptional regulator